MESAHSNDRNAKRTPIQRAQHRSKMELGSALLNLIGAFYNAADEPALSTRAAEIRAHFGQLEAALGGGHRFAGEHFSIVDAVFGPVFRYFEVLDEIDDLGFWSGLPKRQRWRFALSVRPSVSTVVRPDYPELLRRLLAARLLGTPRSVAAVFDAAAVQMLLSNMQLDADHDVDAAVASIINAGRHRAA